MSSQTDTATQVHRLRRAYDNFGKGDLEAIRADFAPDIVWHVGGNNPMTGDYKGLDEVFALFNRFFQETGGTLKNEVHDVLANETHGIVIFQQSAERNGKKLEANIVQVLHFDPEGRITESRFFPAKASEVDQFWS